MKTDSDWKWASGSEEGAPESDAHCSRRWSVGMRELVDDSATDEL